ncbi:MAG: PDZ domain-containing protein, partial [Clostridia bacterium]|nr:PDZ domain-containing protein [Clostridia bacterium]
FGLDSAIASFYGKTVEEDGVYLVNIDLSGPSAKAGLTTGDIIKRIDNYDVATMLDLRSKIYNYDIGNSVTITYVRAGIEKTVQVSLAERP